MTALVESKLSQRTSYPNLAMSSAWQGSGIEFSEQIAHASWNLVVPANNDATLLTFDFEIKHEPACK